MMFVFSFGLKKMDSPNKIGSLENIYIGPMFSGKTSSLIRYLTINADVGFNVLYINSLIDDRTDTDYSTHSSSQTKISTLIKTIKTDYLNDVNIENYDVIGIDEFQFYKDKKPSEIVRKWVFGGKRISVSGLDGDFKIRPFGDILNLIPLCSPGGLFKMKEGICVECVKDGKINPGGFTKKISDTEKIIEVGGKAKYKLVCLKCYFK